MSKQTYIAAFLHPDSICFSSLPSYIPPFTHMLPFAHTNLQQHVLLGLQECKWPTLGLCQSALAFVCARAQAEVGILVHASHAPAPAVSRPALACMEMLCVRMLR